MASALILTGTGVDSGGDVVRLVWKCRRPRAGAPWRWEVRRTLDTFYADRKKLVYHKIISASLPAWTRMWRDAGVMSVMSFWPSRRSVIGQEVDLDLVDEEFSVDTMALVPLGWAHDSFSQKPPCQCHCRVTCQPRRRQIAAMASKCGHLW